MWDDELLRAARSFSGGELLTSDTESPHVVCVKHLSVTGWGRQRLRLLSAVLADLYTLYIPPF